MFDAIKKRFGEWTGKKEPVPEFVEVQEVAPSAPSVSPEVQAAMAEIKALAGRLNLPETVLRDAEKVCTAAMHRGLHQGNIKPVVAASVYIASDRRQIFISFKNLAAISGVNSAEIKKNFVMLKTQLNI